MQVRGLSQRSLRAILEQRGRRGFTNVEDLVRRVPLTIEEARNLVLCGACDRLGASRPELLWRVELALHSRREQRGESNEELFADPPDADDASADGLFPCLEDYDLTRKLELEQRYLDLTASENPLAPFEQLLSARDIVRSVDLPHHVGRIVNIAGFIIAMRRARTKSNEFMKFITIEDRHGLVEVNLFPQAYRRLGARIVTAGPYLVRGQVDAHCGAVTLSAVDLQPVVDPHPPGSAQLNAHLPVRHILDWAHESPGSSLSAPGAPSAEEPLSPLARPADKVKENVAASAKKMKAPRGPATRRLARVRTDDGTQAE